MKVLIVDDSSTMRRIIKNALTNFGLNNLLEAEDGASAWRIMSTTDDISVLITEWKMPNMSGIELVRKIRSHDKYSAIPVVMITTEGGKSEVITALKAGVSSYIVKPFTPQILREKLESILEGRGGYV